MFSKTVFYSILAVLFPLFSYADICKRTNTINTNAYKEEIGTRKVTFVVLDLNTDKCWVINPRGLQQRHTPYSTFKIPHTLIALETSAVSSIDESIAWDQAKHPVHDYWPETWKQSQTLATAFKYSAVWFYKELVPRIEPKQYKTWLARFEYGNQKFTPGSDNFWLDGELKISVEEQVAFIRCLVKTRCGVKQPTLNLFESIALQDTKNNHSLYAKTGAGPADLNDVDGAFEGWYIGYVRGESGEPSAAFAMFVEAESFSELRHFRQDFSLRLLENTGFWR